VILEYHLGFPVINVGTFVPFHFIIFFHALYYTRLGLHCQAPKTESWQGWHIPEMVYSLRDRSSRKVLASPLHITQEASATAPTRDTPVSLESIASTSGLLRVAARSYWLFFMPLLYSILVQMQGITGIFFRS